MRYLFLFISFFLIGGLSATAVEFPYSSAHFISAEDLDNSHKSIYLPDTWKYISSDNDLFSDPWYDDFMWDDVSTLLSPADLPFVEWNGIGWFRLTLDVDPSLVGKTLALDIIYQSGASEIYHNGELLYSFGRVSTAPENEEFSRQKKPVSIVFSEPGIHLIAVRYSNYRAEHFLQAGFNAGFRYLLVDMNHQVSNLLDSTRQYTIQQFMFTGILMVFTLIHFFLFLFYPKHYPNLYFALFAALFGILFYLDYQIFFMTSLEGVVSVLGIRPVIIVLSMILFLLFTYSLFYRQIPPQFWVILLGLLTFGYLSAIKQTHFMEGITLWLTVIFMIEIVRVLFVAIYQKKDGAWIFSTGMLLFVLSQLYAFILNERLIQPFLGLESDMAGIAGIVTLMLTMSISMSRSFAETSKRLELKLIEVQQLSDKTLQQERDQKAREIERRILEVDNQRKTQELEEARQLQLSMLPKSIPAPKDIEIAVMMKTATEVGGDYYDFALSESNELTIAIGDATGHGVKAGIVVATAKSYFNSFATSTTSTIDLLKLMSKGVRNMDLHMLYMTATIIKLTDKQLRLVGAGMPPTLLYKAKSGTVKQLISRGMPLGSKPEFPYHEITESVDSGDILLLSSDGLVEAMDSNRKMFGIERLANDLLENGKSSPEAVIELVYQSMCRWTGTSEIQDDVTMVALKVK